MANRSSAEAVGGALKKIVAGSECKPAIATLRLWMKASKSGLHRLRALPIGDVAASALTQRVAGKAKGR